MDIWESAGHWYVNVDGHERQFDTEAAARQGAQRMAQQTAAEQISSQITSQFQPQLTDLLGKMQLMQRRWEANGITTLVGQATEAGKLLAGYDPAAWGAWGTAFNLLIAYITTPAEELGGATIEQVLLTAYTIQEGDSL